jgi:uncharacterized protein (DUF2236 family)
MSGKSAADNPWLDQDRKTFEACLDVARGAAFGQIEGLFEPGGITWRVLRETILVASGGRSTLLQLCHPSVAQALDSDSVFRRDLNGLLSRTFTALNRSYFGDLDTASKAARYIHDMHDRVFGALSEGTSPQRMGQPYRANDPEALQWVWATMFDSSLVTYERLVTTLLPAERQRIYADMRLFAILMGVPPEQLPAAVSDFQDYFDGMVSGSELEIGGTARRLGNEIFAALGPARGLGRLMTSAWMPEPLRAGFGLTWGPQDQRQYRVAASALRMVLKLTPAALRYTPAYHQATARVAASRQRVPPAASRLVLWVNRLMALPFSL